MDNLFEPPSQKVYMREVEVTYLHSTVPDDKLDTKLIGKIKSGAEILSTGRPVPIGDTRLSNFKDIVKYMRKLNGIL